MEGQFPSTDRVTCVLRYFEAMCNSFEVHLKMMWHFQEIL